MRTKDDIQKQITGLKDMRFVLPEFDIFGDSNWAPIDAQIDVLEEIKDVEYLFTTISYNCRVAAKKAVDWLNSDDSTNLYTL